MKFRYWLIRHLFKYLSRLISIFEKPLINHYGKKKSMIAPVFIVGAPRTGSTILYQLITQYFETIYFDNLVHLARENIYFGFWLSNKFFKNSPHNSFKSKYGNTLKDGLHAPSEAGQIWKKWIPHNPNNPENMSKHQIENVSTNLNAIINKFEKPLIIKNNYNSLHLNLVKEITPSAKIIFIKRNPLFSAQSIIKVRESINQNRNKWWSVKPHNYETFKDLPYTTQVVKQIYYIEKQIYHDLKSFNQDNIWIIDYKELVNQKLFVENFIKFANYSKLRDKINLHKINISERLDLENSIIEELKREIEKYDWENYSR